jgi:predicted  nucleic acid-binding Zn-ribbon protein
MSKQKHDALVNREIERAAERGDDQLHATLVSLHTKLNSSQREISELRGQIWDLKEQIRGARGLLELRKERIEDLLKELGQEETA